MGNYLDEWQLSVTPGDLHPLFCGKRTVRSATDKTKTYTVDLASGCCDCGTTTRKLCAHLFQAASAFIIEYAATHPDDDAESYPLFWAYTRIIATKYNKYEVVSAFHKCLRRGDVEMAVFWGTILCHHRGVSGVGRYMLDIVYEETRDHALYAALTDALANGKLRTPAGDSKRHEQSYVNLRRYITFFCQAKKKWELPGRLYIFVSEMLGYTSLISQFGKDVAKPRDIIPQEGRDALIADLKKGFRSSDKKLFQRAVKGLMKTRGVTPVDVFNLINRLMTDRMFSRATLGSHPFEVDIAAFAKLTALVKRKYETTKALGYHDVNVVADLVMGEDLNYGVTTSTKAKAILTSPDPEGFCIDRAPSIPLYARDNHVWEGKALMKTYFEETHPGADQKHIDLRWCGAYPGVAWRYFAYAQHGTCAVPWKDVKFFMKDTPKNLYDTLGKMYY